MSCNDAEKPSFLSTEQRQRLAQQRLHRHFVGSRAQALAMLESVQRYFRHTEPSSPVPMLCERARVLAERDFMGVLEDVLPKSALKAFNADR